MGGPFKLKGMSFGNSPMRQDEKKDKRKVESTTSTSVKEDGDKYYTYETTMYDYEGNKVTGVSEENTSKVKKDKQGYEYSTVLEGDKKGQKVYWSKPLRP